MSKIFKATNKIRMFKNWDQVPVLVQKETKCYEIMTQEKTISPRKM